MMTVVTLNLKQKVEHGRKGWLNASIVQVQSQRLNATLP